MKLRVQLNGVAMQRLRTRAEALVLSEADRQRLVVPALGAVHVKQVKRAFAAQGATVATGPWPAWSARYAQWRKRNASTFGSAMMRLKGAYRGRVPDQLFLKATQVSHPDNIRLWLGGWRFAFGFRDAVGAAHQQGSGRVPKRSLVDKTPADLKEMTVAFHEVWRKRVDQTVRHA